MAGTIRPDDMDMDLATAPSMSAAALLDTDMTKRPTAPRTPRIDVEPLYAAVKSAIGDGDWTVYKKSLSFFLLGNLNQEELSFKLSRILTTPALDHAHNALFTAIYANLWRDPPDAGIASWVSSSDKPTGGPAKGAHDESEKRLKYEVMQLSRRERKRLKTMPAGDGAATAGADGLLGPAGVGAMGPVQELIDARRVKQPEMGPVGGNQGGGFGKTNWDLEIRKRYTAALFSETHEFPTATTISHRLLPTCYEFGLPQGHTTDCPEYLNIATETYIKEALTHLLGKVCANGPGYIRTGEFKKRVEREERLVERGDLMRVTGGHLPIEADERRKRKLLCMEDLRLALELGDSYLGQTPIIAGSIYNSRFLDTHGIEDLYDEANNKTALSDANINGVSGSTSRLHKFAGQTWNVHIDLEQGHAMQMDVDDQLSAWQGGSVQDVTGMDNVLDDILNLADL